MAAAVARIYYAYPDPNEWAYSGVEGALVFGSQDNGFWFRLVDLGVRSDLPIQRRHADRKPCRAREASSGSTSSTKASSGIKTVPSSTRSQAMCVSCLIHGPSLNSVPTGLYDWDSLLGRGRGFGSE